MRKILTPNKDYINKKFIATRANGCYDNPFEMTILEFSDSGKYVKWKNIQNHDFWDFTDEFEILDTISYKINIEDLYISSKKDEK